MISTHCFDEGETEPLVDSYLCIIYASIGVRDWRMPKWHPLLPGSMCWPDLWIRSDMSLTVSNFGLINQPIKKEILKLPLVLNCLFLHAGLDALLISTILASISLAFINCTLPIVPARIIQVFTNCSLEKSLQPEFSKWETIEIKYLATLTRVDAIVFTAGPVVTNRTELWIWRLRNGTNCGNGCVGGRG